MPHFDVDTSFEIDRGGGTIEAGAPASGIRRGVAHALTPQLKNLLCWYLGRCSTATATRNLTLCAHSINY